jgi:hypothetical protein
MKDAIYAQPGSPLFEGGAAYEAYQDHLHQARLSAYRECREIVEAKGEFYRARANATTDIELGEQRTFAAEACEYLVAAIDKLIEGVK